MDLISSVTPLGCLTIICYLCSDEAQNTANIFHGIVAKSYELYGEDVTINKIPQKSVNNNFFSSWS